MPRSNVDLGFWSPSSDIDMVLPVTVHDLAGLPDYALCRALDIDACTETPCAYADEIWGPFRPSAADKCQRRYFRSETLF